MIRPATEWGRANRSKPPTLGSIQTMTVHYTGVAKVRRTVDQISRYIKSIERYQLNRNSNLSAVSYNFFVDQYGSIWEGRGWSRNAADGNRTFNATSVSVCVLIGVEDTPTKEAIDAVRGLYRIVCARAGRPVTVRGHGAVRATACPGVPLRALIASGALTAPTGAPGPPHRPTQPPAPAPASVAGRPYKVKSGDSYWRIASQHLGGGRRWKEISDLNGGRALHPGMTITLPR